MTETALQASPMGGDKAYQVRARQALPVLVRQAEAGKPVLYSDLAAELKMPNPRNLNYVLGSIGQTLIEYAEATGEQVPPIQCLVVNKSDGLPGEGIGWFLENGSISGGSVENFSGLSSREKRDIVTAELQRIYHFRGWRSILAHFGLEAGVSSSRSAITNAAINRGGESDEHKELKEQVARQPEILGLPKKAKIGEVEAALPSGDRLDVSFQAKDYWYCAEVKSHRSNVADITRGLFQCVKYRAVMKAVVAFEQAECEVQAVLVIQAALPPELLSLRNTLGVRVIENFEY